MHRGSSHATVSKPADPSRQVTPLGQEPSPNVALRRHFVNLARWSSELPRFGRTTHTRRAGAGQGGRRPDGSGAVGL